MLIGFPKPFLVCRHIGRKKVQAMLPYNAIQTAFVKGDELGL